MIRLALVLLFPALLSLALSFALPVRAAETVAIGYVELTEDGRYRADSAYAGIVFRTLGRPWPGARLGVEDAQTLGRVIGTDFTLRKADSALADTVRAWAGQGVTFVLADLPAERLVDLADAVADLPVLLFNISAGDDVLRGKDCRANVVHIAPSDAMRTDALVQHLVERNWRNVLILRGPAEADARLARAFERSASKFGARVVETRPFTLHQDPRERERNNVTLMTQGIDADVIFVADSGGEFGPEVPYATARPTPVVGTHGLVPRAWHWTWRRHGAPQLQHRFEALAAPRRMNDAAWAAWAAVKAITQATLRGGDSFEARQAYILGPDMALDGSKGSAMSVRPWNHQLRQPLLLATAEAVIARAPVAGFLHPSNTLDTLGADAPETACRF